MVQLQEVHYIEDKPVWRARFARLSATKFIDLEYIIFLLVETKIFFWGGKCESKKCYTDTSAIMSPLPCLFVNRWSNIRISRI